MADIVDRKTRSRMMSAIRARNTKPEVLVRKALFAAGYRFRLHRKDLPGTPDIVMSGLRVVIFVHGCFWHAHHGCRFSKTPETRREFWTQKLSRNAQRDLENREALLNAGWRVLVVWECATRRQAGQQAEISTRLIEWIQDETNRAGEIGSPAGHASAS